MFAAAANAEIYHYVDEDGGTHYSDSIESVPPQYLDQIAEVSDQLAELGRFEIVRPPGSEPEIADEADAASALSALSGDLGPGGAIQAAMGMLGAWFILIVLVMLPLVIAIGGMILKLACRLAGAEPPTLGRACAILFAQSIVGSVAGGLVNTISAASGEEVGVGASIAMAGASGILSWTGGAAVLTAMTDNGFGRSLWVGVVHTVLTLVLVMVPIAAVLGIVWLQS